MQLMQHSRIDYLPFPWILLIATLVFVLMWVELGFRAGRYRRRHPKHEHDAPVGSIVNASLVLLAFMLAFTFELAIQRFHETRVLSINDAAAIEKAYLCAKLLPESTSTEVQTLLKEYVDVAVEMGRNLTKFQELLPRSEKLQKALWSRAVAVSKTATSPIMAAVFIRSVSQMIEVRTKRVEWTLRHRILDMIWLTLYIVAALGMGVLGYQAGLSGARSLLPAILVGLAFSMVILLIVTLDRPESKLNMLDNNAMIELQDKITQSNI